MPLADHLGRLDALPGEARRHPDVGDDDLWLVGLGARDQLVVVGGLADDVDVVLELQERLDTLADDQIVVGEKHRDRHSSPCRRVCVPAVLSELATAASG